MLRFATKLPNDDADVAKESAASSLSALLEQYITGLRALGSDRLEDAEVAFGAVLADALWKSSDELWTPKMHDLYSFVNENLGIVLQRKANLSAALDRYVLAASHRSSFQVWSRVASLSRKLGRPMDELRAVDHLRLLAIDYELPRTVHDELDLRAQHLDVLRTPFDVEQTCAVPEVPSFICLQLKEPSFFSLFAALELTASDAFCDNFEVVVPYPDSFIKIKMPTDELPSSAVEGHLLRKSERISRQDSLPKGTAAKKTFEERLAAVVGVNLSELLSTQDESHLSGLPTTTVSKSNATECSINAEPLLLLTCMTAAASECKFGTIGDFCLSVVCRWLQYAEDGDVPLEGATLDKVSSLERLFSLLPQMSGSDFFRYCDLFRLPVPDDRLFDYASLSQLTSWEIRSTMHLLLFTEDTEVVKNLLQKSLSFFGDSDAERVKSFFSRGVMTATSINNRLHELEWKENIETILRLHENGDTADARSLFVRIWHFVSSKLLNFDEGFAASAKACAQFLRKEAPTWRDKKCDFGACVKMYAMACNRLNSPDRGMVQIFGPQLFSAYLSWDSPPAERLALLVDMTLCLVPKYAFAFPTLVAMQIALLFQSPFSDIPEDVNLSSAKLRLYCAFLAHLATFSGLDVRLSIRIHQLICMLCVRFLRDRALTEDFIGYLELMCDRARSETKEFVPQKDRNGDAEWGTFKLTEWAFNFDFDVRLSTVCFLATQLEELTEISDEPYLGTFAIRIFDDLTCMSLHYEDSNCYRFRVSQGIFSRLVFKSIYRRIAPTLEKEYGRLAGGELAVVDSGLAWWTDNALQTVLMPFFVSDPQLLNAPKLPWSLDVAEVPSFDLPPSPVDRNWSVNCDMLFWLGMMTVRLALDREDPEENLSLLVDGTEVLEKSLGFLPPGRRPSVSDCLPLKTLFTTLGASYHVISVALSSGVLPQVYRHVFDFLGYDVASVSLGQRIHASEVARIRCLLLLDSVLKAHPSSVAALEWKLLACLELIRFVRHNMIVLHSEAREADPAEGQPVEDLDDATRQFISAFSDVRRVVDVVPTAVFTSSAILSLRLLLPWMSPTVTRKEVLSHLVRLSWTVCGELRSLLQVPPSSSPDISIRSEFPQQGFDSSVLWFFAAKILRKAAVLQIPLEEEDASSYVSNISQAYGAALSESVVPQGDFMASFLSYLAKIFVQNPSAPESSVLPSIEPFSIAALPRKKGKKDIFDTLISTPQLHYAFEVDINSPLTKVMTGMRELFRFNGDNLFALFIRMARVGLLVVRSIGSTDPRSYSLLETADLLLRLGFRGPDGTFDVRFFPASDKLAKQYFRSWVSFMRSPMRQSLNIRRAFRTMAHLSYDRVIILASSRPLPTPTLMDCLKKTYDAISALCKRDAVMHPDLACDVLKSYLDSVFFAYCAILETRTFVFGNAFLTAVDEDLQLVCGLSTSLGRSMNGMVSEPEGRIYAMMPRLLLVAVRCYLACSDNHGAFRPRFPAAIWAQSAEGTLRNFSGEWEAMMPENQVNLSDFVDFLKKRRRRVVDEHPSLKKSKLTDGDHAAVARAVEESED